jgi:hypothetical protein
MDKRLPSSLLKEQPCDPRKRVAINDKLNQGELLSDHTGSMTKAIYPLDLLLM